MTVLAEYQRLEAEGIWRPSPEAQRRDVIVSIGKATITIAAANGTALTHWSLPAIQRLNPGEDPALYGPGGDAPDTLEVADAEMTEAIDRVLAVIRRKPRGAGWVRRASLFGLLTAFLVLMLVWLPGAITAYTASLVPQGAREAIGQGLLAETERVAGAPCSSPAGDRALGLLSERLFPGEDARLVVLPSALAETAHVPGNVFLIGHRLVEDHETPDVLAGYLAAEDVRRRARDPLARLLAAVPFRASLALLSTGHLRDMDLKRMAEWLVAAPSDTVDDAELIAAMADKQIVSAPYAYARDISGETTIALIEAKSSGSRPVLGDTDWIALQRICGE
ncbi:MAG: hypothetical protein KJN93_04140 [Alphaproteobacteria bacterium]|nr:hypothetical protein [Alphaproteobacteria bacterium]